MDFHPTILRATNARIICQVGSTLAWTAVAMGEVRRESLQLFQHLQRLGHDLNVTKAWEDQAMSCAKFTQGLGGKVPFNLDSTCWKPFAADCNFAHSTEKIALSVWRQGRQACDFCERRPGHQKSELLCMPLRPACGGCFFCLARMCL